MNDNLTVYCYFMLNPFGDIFRYAVAGLSETDPAVTKSVTEICDNYHLEINGCVPWPNGEYIGKLKTLELLVTMKR